MTLLDLWIGVTGLVAVGLLQFGGRSARWYAPFIGLAGQPAWLWHAWQSQAIGIGVVVAAYTLLWAAGCVKAWRGE